MFDLKTEQNFHEFTQMDEEIIEEEIYKLEQ